jgi:PhnB protein
MSMRGRPFVVLVRRALCAETAIPARPTHEEHAMPAIDCYLFFNGNCAEAMGFYERTLGGKLETTMTYADSPPEHRPPGAENLIMHASLSLDGGRSLMGSDVPPGQAYQAMRGFSLSLNYPSVDEARRVFDALAAGGEVKMPLGKTFWAEAFGMLTDRFGTPWMVGGGEHG